MHNECKIDENKAKKTQRSIFLMFLKAGLMKSKSKLLIGSEL